MFRRSQSSRSLVDRKGSSVMVASGSARKNKTVVAYSPGERSARVAVADNALAAPGLRFPVKSSSQMCNSYLERRGVELPIVNQRRFLTAEGKSIGECYLLDNTRTDLIDAAKTALKEDKLLEFNKFKEFKKFSKKINKFSLVKASSFEKLIRKDRTAIHLNRLLIAVIPAVGKGTPGDVTIKIRDSRLEGVYGNLFDCRNPVDCGYVYCVNVGYSVPASELDFEIDIDFDGVPIKDGKSPIWVKTAFHLDDSASPVFLEGTLSIGAEIQADSHKEMLSTSALLLNEVNSNRKSFSGDNGELRDNFYSKAHLEEIMSQDSVSQAGTDNSGLMEDFNPPDSGVPLTEPTVMGDNTQNIAGEETLGLFIAPPAHLKA
nr:movement protein [Black mulberry idaeovirus]